MRTQSFDEQLARLRAIAREPLSDAVVDTLREAINGSRNVLAALAAEIAGHRRIGDLAPDLVRAFGRFMTGQGKGCQAKTAIVNALIRLEHDADEVYLRGIRHIQMEPAFGGQVDVAADVRAGNDQAGLRMDQYLLRADELISTRSSVCPSRH